MPDQHIPRVEFDRIVHRELALHAPLECFFFGQQPIRGMYYSIIPEPGDPIAYSVLAEEWSVFFNLTNDEGLEWYSQERKRLIGRPLSEEEAEILNNVDIGIATPQMGAYLTYTDNIGFRIVCSACAARYCDFSSEPLF